VRSSLTQVLKRLETRGYDVGEIGICPDGIMGAPINGVCYPGPRIRLLAYYEFCKEQDSKVDGLGLKYLAGACRRILEHPSVDSGAANEARDLVHRFEVWENPTDETEGEQITAQARTLCKEMAYLLTRKFPYLWN
jgi:hypothetical protein